jgi:glycosyltransferase involved in cell wall biosynthesis
VNEKLKSKSTEQEGKTIFQMEFTIPNFIFFFLALTVVTAWTGAFLESDTSAVLRCGSQWGTRRLANADITFIVPSKGRSSLIRTFSSLQNQTQHNWVAIVVFDGTLSDSLYLNKTTGLPVFMNMIPPEILLDGRFCFQHLPASGRLSNCAGEIRNFGIALARTEWIGFVDDDDTLRPEYIERLLNHVKEYPKAQLVLFRMCNYFADKNITRVIPELSAKSLVAGDAGISFAFRRRLFQDLHYKLIPSNLEDFLFLDRLYNDHIPILLSEWCTYKVRDHHHPDCEKLGKRTLIQRRLNSPPKYYTEFLNCSVSKPTNLNFVFTDGESIFFRDNVKGLKASLNAAYQRRCLVGQEVYFRSPIHIIFDAATVPISPYYVQVQLEQRNTHHFSEQYMEKLSNALQIWEFSYSDQEGVTNIPNVETDVYFVPTILMLDNSNTSGYHCPSVNPAQSVKFYYRKKDIIANHFQVYRYGQYHTCQYNHQEHGWRLTKSEPSTCYNSRHVTNHNTDNYCWKSATDLKGDGSSAITELDADSFCSEIVNRNVPIDVLMFGALNGSFANQREELCDSLLLTGHEVLCLTSVFGELLNYLVCVSKIVVVNHFYENSALETHRIDSLLQAKKVVVATSSPSALDSYYSHGTLVVKPGKVVPSVEKILLNYDKWIASHNHLKKVDHFLQRMTTNIDPLCYAISQLGEKLKSKYLELHPDKTETDLFFLGLGQSPPPPQPKLKPKTGPKSSWWRRL